MKYTDIELLTLMGLAKSLSLSVQTIEKMVRRGEFPPPLLVGKEQRWPKEDVLRWVELLSNDRWKTDSANRRTEIGAEPRLVESVPDTLSRLRGRLFDTADGPAVYLLLKGNDVIYIGCSLNPLHRVGDHRTGTKKTTRKDFDVALYYLVSLDELLETERTLVAMFNPPMNDYLRTDRVAASANADCVAATDEMKSRQSV